MLGVLVDKKTMIGVMCIGNLLMSLPGLWMPFRRYGPDYTAYVNQAG